MTVPLKALQRQLKALVDDLRRQSEALPRLDAWLHEQYKAAYAARRTGGTYESWREEQLDLAGVAWLLGTVFVRFCEDNHLVNGVWIGGPDGGVDAAIQAKTAYFQEHFRDNDRHWLRAAFGHLRGLGATARLFDDHNAVWRFDISADAAAALLDFWQRGEGLASFHSLDTRFLGDLYQDLSQAARKRYALLQTPEFVEEFILNLTLDESLKEYGLAETSLIDPTCGSGHFLLGAFRRLHARWLREAPAMDPRERVQKALDQVTGVDINPFAVAIARFRLMVEAMQACGETSLESPLGFRIRVATGDSLLKWGDGESSHQGDMVSMLETGSAFTYYTEDGALLADYLVSGKYTVAVGNPPYITVKDKVLNEEYRRLYKDVCSGMYALSVPFTQRFFQLVRNSDESGRAGFVGQITANSFMKREFGKKLIEDYLAKQVELSHVIDTSGAYIPGHGTPTVILIGRRRFPKRQRIRAVLGTLGEPTAPSDPAKGLVWSAIAENIDRPGAANTFVTVSDVPTLFLAYYPWSLSGGGAGDLTTMLAQSTALRLRDRIMEIGRTTHTGADECFYRPAHALTTHGLVDDCVPVVLGEDVRDFTLEPATASLFPYDAQGRPRDDLGTSMWHELFMIRTILRERVDFGRKPDERGLRWFDHSMFFPERFRISLSIAFAFVSTHNHFVLARGGKVFNRTAPVIKLPEGASENDHLALLGLLNSSTACFWLHQVSQSRGEGGGARVTAGYAAMGSEAWKNVFEFTGTKLQAFPLPEGAPLGRARRLDRLAQQLAAVKPLTVCKTGMPSRESLDKAVSEYYRIRGEMIALQEELDWEVYRHYLLLDEDLTAPDDSVPELRLGQRAFEIVLARKVAGGEVETEWFARHGSTPITEIPEHWPAAYRSIVEQRIQIIEERPDIALIERPECKRRWATKPWDVQEKAALRNWLLDRLEAEHLWRDGKKARLLSVAQLADRIGTDPDFRSVLALYCGRDDYDLTAELTKLTADEAVPFLARYRYKPSGLAKRRQWEATWDLQRREDAGEKLPEPIPVPPKYKSEDFARKSYWDNRGKLDVPKERFIAYPKAGRDTDPTPVLGWAGWDHLDQAQALATLYYDRKTNEAWDADRLLPLLAGLVELEPWLHQWYFDPVPGYPSGPATFYTRVVIDTELAALGRGRADLAAEKLP
ncbi:MAG TPA: BREX-2 system adenine-specific DNA-methyltransferase PglX [Kribbellaceae bacterium]|nr:BREX-2 system adenine-specific DNA-methyltransferase PglX [Kribbellaceae bacterium]